MSKWVYWCVCERDTNSLQYETAGVCVWGNGAYMSDYKYVCEDVYSMGKKLWWVYAKDCTDKDKKLWVMNVCEKVTVATSVLNVTCTPSIVLVSHTLSHEQLSSHIMGAYNMWIPLCVSDNSFWLYIFEGIEVCRRVYCTIMKHYDENKYDLWPKLPFIPMYFIPPIKMTKCRHTHKHIKPTKVWNIALSMWTQKTKPSSLGECSPGGYLTSQQDHSGHMFLTEIITLKCPITHTTIPQSLRLIKLPSLFRDPTTISMYKCHRLTTSIFIVRWL